jgi:regulator of nonsense transcripts 2
MRNQQQAEREEQQRIKNLVLNYDLRENEDHDGDYTLLPLNSTQIFTFYPIQVTRERRRIRSTAQRSQSETAEVSVSAGSK